MSNISIAIDAVLANKLRSVLTALGIIFGVSAVIAMLAIGTGAKQEILDQIKLVGVNNIVITPLEMEDETSDNGEKIQKRNLSAGLSLDDAANIARVLPSVSQISPEVEIETFASRTGKGITTKLVGVTPSFFTIFNYKIQNGNRFSDQQLQAGLPVCIIGRDIQTKFFSQEDPIGKKIKCGNNWLTIIGVMEGRKISEAAISNLGLRNFDLDIYIPVKTALLRYRNRSLITEASLKQGFSFDMGSDPEASEDEEQNYHQIDKLIVQVKETEQLVPTTEVISRMLKRRHQQTIDFEITVPELLLKQQQRTKDIFNIVLGAIAGISLIVGGIGIMNIMLASVMERIKEIGLRKSIGATKRDIVLQFLFEAVVISLSGGIIGILLGVFLAKSITQLFEILTIISIPSIFVSFGVAAAIGLIFGIMPAKKAAQQDPIKSLRYE